jgi:hypothetical protein
VANSAGEIGIQSIKEQTMKHTTIITGALLALAGWAQLAAGEKDIELTVTPEKPTVLPDGSTKVVTLRNDVAGLY